MSNNTELYDDDEEYCIDPMRQLLLAWTSQEDEESIHDYRTRINNELMKNPPEWIGENAPWRKGYYD